MAYQYLETVHIALLYQSVPFFFYLLQFIC